MRLILVLLNTLKYKLFLILVFTSLLSIGGISYHVISKFLSIQENDHQSYSVKLGKPFNNSTLEDFKVDAKSNVIDLDLKDNMIVFTNRGKEIAKGELLRPLMEDKRDEFVKIVVLSCISSFSFLCIISLFVMTRLSSRLESLKLVMKSFENGDYSVRCSNPSYDEIGKLERCFNKMAEIITSEITKNEQYSSSLKQIIDEKTSELNQEIELKSNMLNSLGEGFFIFDESLAIYKSYSLITPDLLGSAFVEKNLWKILGLDRNEDNIYLLKSLFSESIPFDSLVGLLPEELHINKKYLKIRYEPVHDCEEKFVKGVVVVIKDISQEKSLDCQIKELEQKSKIVLAVMENPLSVNEIKSILLSYEGQSYNERKIVEDFHSLKGLFLSIGLEDIAKLIHDSESDIIKLDKDKIETYSLTIINQIRLLFDYFIKENSSLFKVSSIEKIGSAKEVDRSDLDLLFSTIKEFLPEETIKNQIVESVFKERTHSLANQIESNILKFEDTFNEKVVFDFESNIEFLDRDFLSSLFSNLLILVKNSFVHGFSGYELEDEKRIFLKLNRINDKISITYGDNGKGIENLNDIGALNQSSQKEATLHSGRGVGVASLMRFVEHKNGNIKIESDDLSTRFEMLFNCNKV